MLLVPSWSESNIVINSVLFSHFGFMTEAHSLQFRSCLNLLVPLLQFAVAHLGYLGLCLEMSYRAVLTARSTDQTQTTCVSGQSVMRQAQSQVKSASYCKNEDKKKNAINENKYWRTVFLFLLFISLHVMSG